MAGVGANKRKLSSVGKDQTSRAHNDAGNNSEELGGSAGGNASAATGWKAKVPRNSLASAADALVSDFKAPDAAEVLDIAHTQNLYKSNLFRLQIEELLRELAPIQPHKQVDKCLRSLQPVLESLPPRSISDFGTEFPNMSFHLQHPFPFTFSAPSRIDVVGSFLLGTSSHSCVTADVALEIPAKSFQSKDFLNFRYLDKRAAYAGELHRQLSATAAKLESPLAGLDVVLEAFHGDPFRPCVVLRPNQAVQEPHATRVASGGSWYGSWSIRLLPVYAANAEGLWAASRLAPTRNAVRAIGTQAEAVPTPEAGPATPHYNSCMLEDARMRAHLEAQHRAMQKVPAARGAVLLLKRWAAARGFLPRSSGIAVYVPLSGFCLSMLASHAALTASVAPAQTSPFQLFKLSLSVVASMDWTSDKLLFGTPVAARLTNDERLLGGAHFYDGDGVCNIFWRLGPFITEVKEEAQRTLRILDAEADSFDAVFGVCSSPELLWDLVVRTPPLSMSSMCPELSFASFGLSTSLSRDVAADAPQALAIAHLLPAILQAGLGNRCHRVVSRLLGNPALHCSGSQPGDRFAVMLGVTIDSANAERTLDRGPLAQDAEAAKRFRELWGEEKAELRRFKDGSIQECVVWAKPPLGDVETTKHPAVITQIVKHLLARHVPDLAAQCDLSAGPIGFVQNLGDLERRLWLAFDVFRTHLCQLSSLPLAIKDIHPADASFCYMEVLPPAAPAAPDRVARTLHGVVVEFESSGRWPEEPEAARKVAAALLLQMRAELRTEMGLEADVTEHFLDVRYPEFVFRISIFHPYELLGAAQHITNFQVNKCSPPSRDAVERLRSLWWRPRVRSTLHALALHRPALAGAVRLCKRWMGSQMLSGYDEFVEHLAAFVFLRPTPFDVPTSPQVAFCRICWLLSTVDWAHGPLVVDFDGKLTPEDSLHIRQSFEQKRADGSGKYFWVSSRFDPHCALLETPPATVSSWLQRRASQALMVFQQQLIGCGPSTNRWQGLFALQRSTFDVLLLPGVGEGDRGERGEKGETGEVGEGEKGEKGEKSATASSARPPVRSRQRTAAARAALDALARGLQPWSPAALVFQDVERGQVALKWRPSAFLPQPQAALMGVIPHTLIAQAGRPPLFVPNVLQLTTMLASLADGLNAEVILAGTT